jgi:hypothetical protein
MTLNLTKNETAILDTAALRAGALRCPAGMKPTTWERALGRFLRDGLVEEIGDGHRLIAAGYRAIGQEPPRSVAGSKKALVAALLGRDEGASMAELISATGWLPHTTRAALSRLRTAGQELAKSARADGTTAYRLQGEAVAP